ncbi:5 TM domain-containing transmembrane protein [Acrasis kona]|uniref:5 TM domain-containing transmembrane protein n=1 Tax=Acrasis kona TaxID=1008807 RepID=A0AAW2ZAH8_9EUKA
MSWWWVVVTFALATALPNLIVFSISTEAAFRFLNLIYPNIQDPTPFLKNKTPITVHIYLNAAALIIGAFQFKSLGYNHKLFGYLYTVCLVVGSVGAVNYAFSRDFGTDGGFAAQFSFLWMAIASVSPCLIGAYEIVINKDILSHRQWMIRSYACLFGSGFLFRLFANIYLPFAPSNDRYPAWIAMIWMSWVMPLMMVEVYINSLNKQLYNQLYMQKTKNK